MGITHQKITTGQAENRFIPVTTKVHPNDSAFFLLRGFPSVPGQQIFSPEKNVMSCKLKFRYMHLKNIQL